MQAQHRRSAHTHTHTHTYTHKHAQQCAVQMRLCPTQPDSTPPSARAARHITRIAKPYRRSLTAQAALHTRGGSLLCHLLPQAPQGRAITNRLTQHTPTANRNPQLTRAPRAAAPVHAPPAHRSCSHICTKGWMETCKTWLPLGLQLECMYWLHAGACPVLFLHWFAAQTEAGVLCKNSTAPRIAQGALNLGLNSSSNVTCLHPCARHKRPQMKSPTHTVSSI